MDWVHSTRSSRRTVEMDPSKFDSTNYPSLHDVKSDRFCSGDEEQAALLGMKDEARSSCTSITLAEESEATTSKRRTRFLMLSITAHLILALISIGSLVVTLGFRDERCIHGARDVIYSPARDVVTYEPRLMNNSLEEGNAFKGTSPTTQQTMAWRELLAPQMVVLSEEDMKQLGRLNEHSVKIEDGSGYLGQLDMYHQLHCLNYIREFMHRDYYDSIEKPDIQLTHVDHCIDTLRQIIICHADTAIVTYDWRDSHRTPYPNFAVERECRNWDQFYDFVQSNQPDLTEGMLVHPKYGPVKEGKHHEGRRASPRRPF